jgi:hypothetical protein
MPVPIDVETCEKIYGIVAGHSGISPTKLANQAGLSPDALRNALISMERRGFLLSEDKRGRLWSFARRRFNSQEDFRNKALRLTTTI